VLLCKEESTFSRIPTTPALSSPNDTQLQDKLIEYFATMTNISLNCWVVGEPPNQIFTCHATDTTTVADLKEVICKKRADLQIVNHTYLNLYNVSEIILMFLPRTQVQACFI
jgi:hypothetical protein